MVPCHLYSWTRRRDSAFSSNDGIWVPHGIIIGWAKFEGMNLDEHPFLHHFSHECPKVIARTLLSWVSSQLSLPRIDDWSRRPSLVAFHLVEAAHDIKKEQALKWWSPGHHFNWLVFTGFHGKNDRNIPWSSWENRWFPVKILPEANPLNHGCFKRTGWWPGGYPHDLESPKWLGTMWKNMPFLPE